MTGTRQNRLVDWFREWRLPLRRYIRRKRLGSSADIDDIAQEVFLRLLRYDRSELVDSPQSYLYRVAVNVSAEWATRSSRRMPHNSEWLADLVDNLCPESEVEREGTEIELQQAVERLPSRCREILRLQYDEGLSHAEIAERLSLTARVVRRDIERAHTMLRASLDPDLLGRVPDTHPRGQS
jgi:RNA polymerase sigma-70 factor (ECF subfamily)